MKTIKRLFILIMLMSLSRQVYAKNQLPPNEAGEIMILMYHGLTAATPKENYMRSISSFKSDLNLLYENGYRLISLSDLLDNNITVEAGCTPVILTFDDGYNTAFSLIEKDDTLIPKPNCAVDIINKFNEEHPDFGKAGVFYICDSGRIPFNGAGTLKDRFQYLVENGYELGNHTATHTELNKLSRDRIMEEMGKVEELVRLELPGYRMRSMSYPYGYMPGKENQDAALEGRYKDIEYSYDIGLREKITDASTVPANYGFDPYYVPRVRGSSNAVRDLGWYIKHYNEHPEERYVSDGDGETITIPQKYLNRVNIWQLTDKFVKIV